MLFLSSWLRRGKLNVDNLELGLIHPKFQKAIKKAPFIEKGDYQSIFKVIQGWFNDKLFRYSMLDRFNQDGGQLVIKDNSLYFYGSHHSCSLAYDSGICYSLACKLHYLLNICYPWFDTSLTEVGNWKNTYSNHFYLVFATSGFVSYPSNLPFSTNSFVSNSSNPEIHSNFKFQGDLYALDPCSGEICRVGENGYLCSGEGVSHRIALKYNDFSDAENLLNSPTHTIFIYSESCFTGNSIRLGFDNGDLSKCSWFMVRDHKTTKFEFHDPAFLSEIKKVYPNAHADFTKLVKRGYTVSG